MLRRVDAGQSTLYRHTSSLGVERVARSQLQRSPSGDRPGFTAPSLHNAA